MRGYTRAAYQRMCQAHQCVRLIPNRPERPFDVGRQDTHPVLEDLSVHAVTDQGYPQSTRGLGVEKTDIRIL